MNILENVLKQFIKVPKNLFEVTNKQIIEVDEYVALNESTNLATGYVLTCEKHPNSDHLHVTTVDVGTEVLQIVCGAANIASKQYVIVAKVGAVLPGNFEIKKAVVRGVESNGMICSLNELGFDEKHIPSDMASGIYHFPKSVKLGVDPLKLLGLDGKKLVLGMTTNRGDLLSHLGFAYDLASMIKKEVKLPKTTFKESKLKNDIEVKINYDRCLSYEARVLEVTVKDSPWWLKNALIQSGIRPINNVVDITNYVLITYGTPLHAFDYQKVDSKEIVVRNAYENEEVYTLDDEKRVLDETDIVITNGKKPIALGGVMGLANSAIDDHTHKIILEAALFDKQNILKTSTRLGLKSDSSLRFERGVDQSRVHLGLEAATELLTKYAHAKVYEGISKSVAKLEENPKILLDMNRLNAKLGLNLTKDQVISLLKRLNYQITGKKEMYVSAPLYRKDILIEADIVEEIARIYGYDQIPNHFLAIQNQGKLTHVQQKLRNLKHTLAGLGFNEVINYSLLSEQEVTEFPLIGEPVKLLMPMSEDRMILRQSLIPGLLSTARYHLSRQMSDLALFEMGHVFAKDVENNHIAGLLEGKFVDGTWSKKDLESSYYVIKGIVEKIASSLDVELTFRKVDEVSALHPGISSAIYLKDVLIGYIGKIHPSMEEHYDIKNVYVFELDLGFLKEAKPIVKMEAISKFPSISRDLSFVVKKDVAINEILALIKQTARKLIVDVTLFDVYEGKNLESGYQSLAVSITFNDKEKTLEKNDVEKALKSIKNRLEFTYKTVFRD